MAGIPKTNEKLVFEKDDAKTKTGEGASSVLFDILNLEQIDTHLFRGYSPVKPRWGRIYGGQTVGQALVAAGRTTDTHFVVHSLHAMFIRPGNDDIPVLYQVDVTRDGQTFCTRRVRALQNGKDIFIASVSFKLIEKPPQYSHSEAMPAVPDPESLKSIWEPYRKRFEKSGVDEFPFPVDIKRVSPIPDKDGFMPRSTEAETKSWVRVNGRLPDSPLVHNCAMSYLSDWGLLATALIPHGYNIRGNKHVQMASIDHSIWFHAPFRADDWLLHHTYSPRASNGTSLNFGKFFTRAGVHCVSTAQEGLIRLIANAGPERSLSTSTTAAAATTAVAAAAAAAAPTSAATATAVTTTKATKAGAAGGTDPRFAAPSRYFETITTAKPTTAAAVPSALPLVTIAPSATTAKAVRVDGIITPPPAAVGPHQLTRLDAEAYTKSNTTAAATSTVAATNAHPQLVSRL